MASLSTIVRECVVGASLMGCPVIHLPQMFGPRGKQKDCRFESGARHLVYLDKRRKEMLRVTLGSDEVEIRFDHGWCDPSEIEDITGVCVDDERRCTMVSATLNGKRVGNGMVICHPGDNFCKSTGRKKALAYALHPLEKELRTAVWEEYRYQMGF